MNVNFAFCAFLIVALAWAGGDALAGPTSEIGDAGALPGSAQTLPGGTTSVSGSIAYDGDADLYHFGWGGGSFYVSTTGTHDTQLFLFNSGGFGIEGDDDDGSGLLSLISRTLAPGDYYLGISDFDNDPLGPGGKIFTNNFTGTQTPTGPGGPGPLTGWSQGIGTGEYTIHFRYPTSSVPEPASLALLGLGLAGFVARRRRSSRI